MRFEPSRIDLRGRFSAIRNQDSYVVRCSSFEHIPCTGIKLAGDFAVNVGIASQRVVQDRHCKCFCCCVIRAVISVLPQEPVMLARVTTTRSAKTKGAQFRVD